MFWKLGVIDCVDDSHIVGTLAIIREIMILIDSFIKFQYLAYVVAYGIIFLNAKEFFAYAQSYSLHDTNLSLL